MLRIWACLVGVVIVGAVLCIPAAIWGRVSGDQNGVETTTITKYDAQFSLAGNGDLKVVENLDVQVPGSATHGIFRFFDIADPNAPHARRIPEAITVTRDGSPDEVKISHQGLGRYEVVRVGNPGRTLAPGVHHYTIGYELPGVIIPSAGGSAFYWNLVPGGWRQSISDIDLRVHLPKASAVTVPCAVGAGLSSGCTVQGAGTQDLAVHVDHLAPDTPVTIKASMAMAAPAEGHHLPWTASWDPVLGTRAWLVPIVALLALLAGAVGAWLSARTLERTPGFPLQYAPPEGIGPAQAAYILHETTPQRAYVASLLYAADKGLVSMESPEKHSWTVTSKDAAAEGLDDVTRSTVHSLVGSGSFTASRKDVAAGLQLKQQLESFRSRVRTWGTASGNLSRAGFASWGRVAVIACAVLVAVCLFLRPLGMSMTGLVPAAFAMMGLSLLRPGAATYRTAQGRELWSRVGGFKRILETPSSKERFDFSGRQELYTAYIPWAVAFDCADQWAEKYRTEVGAEPPVPAYFAGGYYAGSINQSVGSMVEDFDRTVSSAISSYDATQRSSGGGGGGGFSGGGGGGGGGGGSW